MLDLLTRYLLNAVNNLQQSHCVHNICSSTTTSKKRLSEVWGIR